MGNYLRFTVLLALTFSVKGKDSRGSHLAPAPGNEIPARCVANSVTRVSCADVSSPDALLPHPDDCNLFYYCVSADTEPVCRQCPAGLSFNPELHVCDVPAHAGCRAGNAMAMTDSMSIRVAV
ncbi:hypothetical protein ABMA28_001249 [Loxostege sticticalis]|uniref:Chitin-binding type-2 domain-containing protein n=1 Tax=Loxostege sticticalis TaxID=481309 RepID=A0ABD0T126_LOXSC